MKRAAYHALALSAMLAALSGMGCASPAKQVLTSANGYTYWMDRHAERCPSLTEALCKETPVLTRWHTALGEANAALQRGGKLPLQLQQLKRVEKESKQWRP